MPVTDENSETARAVLEVLTGATDARGRAGEDAGGVVVGVGGVAPTSAREGGMTGSGSDAGAGSGSGGVGRLDGAGVNRVSSVARRQRKAAKARSVNGA